MLHLYNLVFYIYIQKTKQCKLKEMAKVLYFFSRLTMQISLSKQLKSIQQVTLANTFICEYMPVAPEQYTKVYLMGLALMSSDNSGLEQIAVTLSMDANAVLEAFGYWHEQGLVNYSTDPLSIEYIPVTPLSGRIKKFSKEKYKAFNEQLHSMIKDRNILPSEYNEYYSCIETYGIEIEAMLIIIAYCIRLKGNSVGSAYILAVARNLAHAGARTYDRVQEHLSGLDLYDEDLKAVLKTLKIRRGAEHNDKNLLHKWKKELGFSQEVIIKVAKNVTKGGIDTLNMLLTRYYENNIFTMKEITAFNDARDKTFALTKNILKILGLRYDSFDYIIETYISPFLRQGFSEESLCLIADYCFRRNIRGLEGMNGVVQKFYKQGLVSVQSINGFLSDSIAQDGDVKEVLAKLNLLRPVTSYDRDYYKTWTRDWNTSKELLDYACSLSKDKTSPVSYLNSILASWYEKKITTLKDAKAVSENPSGGKGEKPKPNDNLVKRNLSAEELNAMFDRLEDDEL